MTTPKTPRLLNCGFCYEEQGEEVHPHPECPVGKVSPADGASLATGLRAAANEIAGIDFHPNARARSLDIAAGLARRLRRMADQTEAELRRVADETADTETQARPEVDVDTLARLMCDADVHVNNGDYPGWDELSKEPGRGQDEVRKAARYLLKRLHITERQPAVGARQDGAQQQ